MLFRTLLHTHTHSQHIHPHIRTLTSILASSLHTSHFTHQHFFTHLHINTSSHIYTLLTITTDEDYEDSYFFFLVLHLYIQYCI